LRVLSAGSPRRGFLFLYPSATAPTHASESQRVTAAVLEASALHGWQTIICGEGSNAVISTSIDVSEKEAVLRSGEIVENFLPDLLQPDVFDRFCRSAAKAGRKPKTSGVPDACSLWDLLDAHPKAIASRWAASERDNRLVAPIGQGRSGPQLLDLNRDGPHVLVAGTTGAGKSELLRTLVAALALIHPPDSVNFIFIDFKGGSGLAPLAGLPHCVGMLTDLGQDSLDRSLQSLRAEIRLRERLFALSNVPDLAAYRLQREYTSGQSATGTSPSLPHLVLVIDEFRMLVDEAPSALAELMRIAAIGRSLGLHLVMATQRPQGALTADIRANVTSSIALRVQSEADSHDILNSRLAAGISVSTPGRAYLARGSEGPEEFQTATFTPVSENPGFLHITIREAATALCKPETHLEQKQPATPTPSLAGAPLVAAVQSVWEGLRREQPRRPIAPPLPASVIFPEKPEDETEISIALGIADLPEEQRLEWLKWWPYRQGHLALVGTAFGTGKRCRAVAAALVSHTVESHMYVLDADGAFPTVASLERVGAVVMTNEPFRAARLLQRLAHEVSLRATGAGKSDDPPLVLVITGWGRWTASFRSGPYMWAEELVHELIRAGRAGGLAIVISGDRELIGARFFPALDTHAFFPEGSTEEARFSWPKLPDIGSIPGRAVVRGSAAGGRSCVAQFAQPESDVDWPYMPARPALHKAFKVLPLPQLVTVDEVLKRRSARLPVPREKTEISGRDLWVGVGGDELEPASLRLIPGGSFLALGGPGSGKSTLMKVLPLLNPGQVWLRPGDTNDPAEYWTALWRNRSESRRERRETMLIDDFDRLSPECQHYLADLNRMGLAAVLTASLHVPLQGSLLASKARACGSGLLLAPRRLADGDFFGIRYEVEQSPPPGRAVLFRSGRPEAIQLAIDKHPS
jgi:S-DNA-T family DNA segregation ATPase FtsK/SpoIIIE